MVRKEHVTANDARSFNNYEVISDSQQGQSAFPMYVIIIIIIITAIEFSLCGSNPYTSTDKTNNIHKRNNTKTQYEQ